MRRKVEIPHEPGKPVETAITSENEVAIPHVDTTLTSDLRAILLDNLASHDDTDEDCESCLEYSALSAMMELNSIGPTTKHNSNIITWDDVRNATTADATIKTILQLVAKGFPTDARTLPATVRPYHSLSSSLYELDGVLMLSDRIVIPPSLRPAILNLLHAAHQGIDRMKARASDTVFWPGMTGDISRVRWECMDCHKIAKSNPQAPPAHPAEPQYLGG